MKGSLILLVAGCTLGLTVPALAVNVGFLKDAPYFTHFTEEDRNIFRAALEQTLAESQQNKLHNWTNPNTGANGEIVVLETLDLPNKTCHRVNITNKAKGRVGKGKHVFCPKTDGSWSLVPGKSGPSKQKNSK